MKTVLVTGLSILFLASGDVYAQKKSAEDWFAEGFQLSLEGRNEEAVSAYHKALRLKPRWAEAHHGLAVLYFRMQNGPQTIYHLRKAEKLYLKEGGPDSEKNLQIVRNNLKKSYARFDLDPGEFEEMESLHPVPVGTDWIARGNGFVFGNGRYLWTLRHKILDAKAVRIRFADGTIAATRLVKQFIIYDLALLRLEEPDRHSISGFNLGDASRLNIGDPLFALGTAEKGTEPSQPAAEGRVTGLKAILDDDRIVQMDFGNEPELSGGPLLNADGDAVGIILSVQHTMQNFQAAGRSPEGGIALKSTYLDRMFRNVVGSQKHIPGSPSPGSKKPDSKKKISGLVLIEISK